MNARARHNVVVHGDEGRPMVFAHGFGCDQNMWRHVWPAFAANYRIVLFDHIGNGGSVTSAFDPDRYSSLEGYARDVLEICDELHLDDVVFVGHSVSAMIGVLAAAAEQNGSGRWSSSVHRLATSTRASTSVGSAAKTSRACSNRWRATI